MRLLRHMLYPTSLALRVMLLLFVLSPLASVEAETSILYVTSGQSDLYNRFCQQTTAELRRTTYDLITDKIVTADILTAAPATISLNSYSLIVAVGHHASLAVAKQNKTAPALYTLITNRTYLLLQPFIQGNATGNPFSAIYLEQPLERQLQTISIAMPGITSLGVVLSTDQQDTLMPLEQLAEQYKLMIHSRVYRGDTNIVDNIEAVLAESDALLALPDDKIYNNLTNQAVLLAAYRSNKPMIAFSKAYVNAGATLAVYSSPEQIAQQSAELIDQFIKSKKRELPAPAYPKYYSIAYNRYISKSLGLHLESNPEFLKQLELHPDK